MLVTGFAARPAVASWMVPPAPDRPKDFAFIKRDGLYHLFYIRNNPNVDPESTQVDFGHATSPDLYFWDFHPNILHVRAGHFDRSHVWAPTIVERDSVYYLFYAGVSDSAGYEQGAQRIGIATSTDLETWNPAELPVFTADQVPWAWADSLQSAPFRDPFVMPNPDQAGQWLMYYSTARADDPSYMIAGIAVSDGDFSQWRDLGPLWITDHTWSYNAVVESPHLFVHDGLWWLFFTTNSGQPISYATSSDPLAPPEQWVYRGRLANLLNLDTTGWFASEYLKDGLRDYFAFVNGDRIEVSQMHWTSDLLFTLLQPDLFHVRTLTWETPSVREGSTATLDILSKWWSGHTLDLECFWVDSTGTWNSIPNSAIGIPDHIPLDADSVAYSWLAQAPPDTTVPDSVEIIVRTLDQTATANPIWLVRTPSGNPIINPGLNPPPEPQPQGPGLEEIDPDPQPILRTLAHSVLGAAAGLVVDLRQASEARLDVFDLQGRRVRTLADRQLPAGATVIGWDGRDEAGRRLSRGLYFARLTMPREVRTARILLR